MHQTFITIVPQVKVEDLGMMAWELILFQKQDLEVLVLMVVEVDIILIHHQNQSLKVALFKIGIEDLGAKGRGRIGVEAQVEVRVSVVGGEAEV